MTDFVDKYLAGEPVIMATFLASLGHPDYASSGTPVADGVEVFGPVVLTRVVGRATIFALVRMASDVVLELPSGVTQENEILAGTVVGGFMADSPKSCTNAQMRAVLAQMPSSTAPGNTLLTDVDTWARSAGGATWVAWEYANEFTLDGALVSAARDALGFSEQQLRDLFAAAAAVQF